LRLLLELHRQISLQTISANDQLIKPETDTIGFDDNFSYQLSGVTDGDFPLENDPAIKMVL